MKFQIILCFALLFVAVSCDDTPTETESDTCEPGQEYKLSCNTCKCADSGKKSESACTLMACPEDAPSSTTAEPDVDKCDPGTSFIMDGCNTCICPDDGNKAHAACTVMSC